MASEARGGGVLVIRKLAATAVQLVFEAFPSLTRIVTQAERDIADAASLHLAIALARDGVFQYINDRDGGEDVIVISVAEFRKLGGKVPE